MSQLAFDEQVAKQLEVLYRTRDVERRRRLVREAHRLEPGQRVLEVGCGPGFYAAEILDLVGPEGAVVGVDASPQMLAVARHRSEGRPNARFLEADATALPVEDEDFDRALSVQVLEYVTDLPAALAELHRVLRPGGRVVIWDVDWRTLSWHSSDPARMERVLDAWDGHLADPSLPRTLTAQLRAAGFEDVTMDGHTSATNELSADSYAGGALPVIERYVAGSGAVPADELEAWAEEQRALDERGELYFACVQFRFAATRAA